MSRDYYPEGDNQLKRINNITEKNQMDQMGHLASNLYRDFLNLNMYNNSHQQVEPVLDYQGAVYNTPGDMSKNNPSYELPYDGANNSKGNSNIDLQKNYHYVQEPPEHREMVAGSFPEEKQKDNTHCK